MGSAKSSIANVLTGGLYGGISNMLHNNQPGQAQMDSKQNAIRQGSKAADEYWGRVTSANDQLKKDLDNIQNGYSGDITDYKNTTQGYLNNYNANVANATAQANNNLATERQNIANALDKYTGDNAIKAIDKNAGQMASKNAAKAAAESVGGMRAAGLSPNAVAALTSSNTINAYNQGYGQQQQLASNQYAAAAQGAQNVYGQSSQNILNSLNSSLGAYGTSLNGGLQSQSNALSAAGNKAQLGMQGKSAVASNQIGAAAQDVANQQNQAGTAQNAQNVVEKIGGDFSAFGLV